MGTSEYVFENEVFPYVAGKIRYGQLDKGTNLCYFKSSPQDKLQEQSNEVKRNNDPVGSRPIQRVVVVGNPLPREKSPTPSRNSNAPTRCRLKSKRKSNRGKRKGKTRSRASSHDQAVWPCSIRELEILPKKKPDMTYFGLHYEFRQGTVAGLSQALENYISTRELARSVGAEHAFVMNNALQHGAVLNHLLRNQAPVSTQLSTAMIKGFGSVSVHKDWDDLAEGGFVPSTILSRMIQQTHTAEYVQNVMRFRSGLWNSRTFTIAELLDLNRIGWVKLHPMVAQLWLTSRKTLAKIEEKYAQGLSYAEEAEELALGFSDMWTLGLIIRLPDYADPDSSTPYALPCAYAFDLKVWHNALRLIGLSRLQLQQCMVANRHLKLSASKISRLKSQLRAELTPLLEQEVNTETDLSILQLMECLRVNELDHRAVMAEAVFVFLFKILKPSQAATFVRYIQMKSEMMLVHLIDWMRHVFMFLVGEEESMWIHDHSIVDSEYVVL